MSLLVDTTPLRVSRDFRRLWLGQAVSFAGSTITAAALPFQVFHQTGSSLDVGLLGVAQLGPLLLCSLAGGALADAVDKRLLLLIVTFVSLACSALLAVNAWLSHPQLWLLYVLGAASSAAFAVSFPVLRSLLPLLLEESLRPAAFALQSTYGSFGMMAGPAVSGLIIGAAGVKAAYSVDVATYFAALWFFARIASSPPVSAGARASRSSVVEGLRFLRGHSVIMSVFGIDLLAMVFGMPRALFPALTQRLGGGPVMYGLLLSSVAAGAFVASITSGWTGRVERQGRAVLFAVAAWGLAIAVAGLVRVPAIVMLMLAVAGASDMISGVYRSAVAADVTPDDMRGRVSGVEIAVYAGGPVVGDVEAGIVGGLVGVPFAIVSGGIACVVSAALFAARVRSFATYRRHAPADPLPPERASGASGAASIAD
ncbi:MAG TPA: MFS transporter [Acidimicrobiia bacterium]|jgi:MFS family permease|nr:MFS transporter [Acidimicrobiia bacterium]